MNQYETVFILTPVLSDVQMKEEGITINMYVWKVIEKFGGLKII